MIHHANLEHTTAPRNEKYIEILCTTPILVICNLKPDLKLTSPLHANT